MAEKKCKSCSKPIRNVEFRMVFWGIVISSFTIYGFYEAVSKLISLIN